VQGQFSRLFGVRNMEMWSNIARVSVLGLFLFFLGASGQRAVAAEGAGERLSPYYGFGPMEIIKLDWGLNTPVAADINGDGLTDLLVINNRKARIELLLQKPDFDPNAVEPPEPEGEDINDLFGRERTWRYRRVSFPLDVEAQSLVVGHLNADELLDMAFYSKEGVHVVVQEATEEATTDGAENEPAAPVWSPTTKVDVREGQSRDGSLRAGDLNGDGRMDLALLAQKSVYIFLQDEQGKLGEPQRYYSASGNLAGQEIGDVNGDGRDDVIMLASGRQEYPVRVRLQMANGQLGPEQRLALPAPAMLEVAKLGKAGCSFFLSVSQQGGRVVVSSLPTEPESHDYPVFAYPLPATENSEQRDIVAADVDGDGLLDVVASDPFRAEFLLFRAKEGTSLTTAESFPGLKSMSKLAAVRLGSDKAEAIVVLSREEKLIGCSRFEKGRLTFPANVAVAGEPQAMDVGDVDGDGQADLLYVAKKKHADGGKDTFVLQSLLKLGAEGAEAGPELELSELKDPPGDMLAGDFDHDGRLDVLVVRPYQPLLLVRQKSQGVFEQETGEQINAGLVAQVRSENLSLAPLATDGGTALLVVRKNFARSLSFDAERGWQVLDQYQADHPQSSLTTATTYRRTSDEALLIAAYDNARGKLAILSPQADGTYRTARKLDMGALRARKILAGNLGGAAGTGLVICGPDQFVRVALIERAYRLRQLTVFEPTIKKGRFGWLAVGDLNGDGVAEVTLCEHGKHHIQVLAFDEEAQLVEATRFKVFEQPRGTSEMSRVSQGGGEPRAARIADVTGDGKNDLIVLVHDRLIIYPQD